jgi:hypothetical protein
MLRFKITLNVKLTNKLRPECNWRLQAYTQKPKRGAEAGSGGLVVRSGDSGVDRVVESI